MMVLVPLQTGIETREEDEAMVVVLLLLLLIEVPLFVYGSVWSQREELH